MADSVLAILKVAFLAGLYLFLARVVRAVWVEIHAERGSLAERVRTGAEPASAASATESISSARQAPAPVPMPAGKQSRREAKRTYSLKIVEPPERRGRTFAMIDEMTVGRAAGCAISIDDPLISQLHARVFRRDGQFFVEDLGSTNGTFLNRKPVGGPIPLTQTDRISVGDTVLEVKLDK
jgi:FHA domain